MSAMFTPNNSMEFESFWEGLDVGSEMQYDHHQYVRVPGGWVMDGKVFIPMVKS